MQPLPCICTRSGELASDAVTLVSYHAKNPSYYDEFKICLPPTITPAHHLLFTLYHIPVQIAKNKDVAPEVLPTNQPTNQHTIAAAAAATHLVACAISILVRNVGAA